MIKILFFGDIIGKPGRNAIKKILPGLKNQYQPNLIIANVENLAHGLGVTSSTLNEMIEAGIDVFTSGNHIFDKLEEATALLNKPNSPLLRPLNYPQNDPGKGAKIINIENTKIAIISLQGRVFMKEDIADPFSETKKFINENKKEVKIFIIDFHADATSEKVALMHYLDGEVSAILGTHTHVPTADSKITKEGTAYITDVGMTGPIDSIIGQKKEPIIQQYLTQISQKKDVPEDGEQEINAVYLEIDGNTGKAIKIEKIYQIL